MNRVKIYNIKKGKILFREKKKFKTIFHEILWKTSMRFKGYIIENGYNE